MPVVLRRRRLTVDDQGQLMKAKVTHFGFRYNSTTAADAATRLAGPNPGAN